MCSRRKKNNNQNMGIEWSTMMRILEIIKHRALVSEMYFKHMQIRPICCVKSLVLFAMQNVQSTETTKMFDLFRSRYAEVL